VQQTGWSKACIYGFWQQINPDYAAWCPLKYRMKASVVSKVGILLARMLFVCLFVCLLFFFSFAWFLVFIAELILIFSFPGDASAWWSVARL
jgi:hypothetical protein